MSKGSRPRPFGVSQQEYDTRWDAIFRRDGLDDKIKNLAEQAPADDKQTTDQTNQVEFSRNNQRVSLL